MHQSGVLLDRVLNIQHRRQLVVIYFNQLQRFLRRVDGQRRNGSHRITDVANLFDRNDRLIFEHRAVVGLDALIMKNVLARQYRYDAANFLRVRSIDAIDARMRIRTAQNLPVTHPRHAHVRQVLRPPGDFGFIIQATKRLSNIG